MFTPDIHTPSVLDAAEPSEEIFDRHFGDFADGQVKNRQLQPFSVVPPIMYQADEAVDPRPVLAIFCFEDGGSVVGQFVRKLAAALATRQLNVHVFARKSFEVAGAPLHIVGDAHDGDLFDQVQGFARRAGNEFLRLFRPASAPITLLGCEWSAVPVMTTLQGIKNVSFLWSVHCLERQRSNTFGELSSRIEEIELVGLRTAKSILIHDPATADAAKSCVPECGERIVNARHFFLVAHFNTIGVPGQINAR